ncbi:MAG: Rrf2 family transcriptional regulator [Candidatus Omnitrophica bacterium]|nr:Rrf2 family transcriptional regulator [Candidatus Omnitrophota bacterium]
MKITYRGDYALKAILDLALNDGSIVTIHDLAERAQIPFKFLEQVLLDLKRGGFVESRRGKVGGYLLAKKPEEITIGEVIRFVDGPIEPIACIGKDYSGCSDIYKCVFRHIWQDVGSAISGIVDNITFKDLVSQAQIKKEALVYQI